MDVRCRGVCCAGQQTHGGLRAPDGLQSQQPVKTMGLQTEVASRALGPLQRPSRDPVEEGSGERTSTGDAGAREAPVLPYDLFLHSELLQSGSQSSLPYCFQT